MANWLQTLICKITMNHEEYISYNPFRCECPNCGWVSKGWSVEHKWKGKK